MKVSVGRAGAGASVETTAGTDDWTCTVLPAAGATGPSLGMAEADSWIDALLTTAGATGVTEAVMVEYVMNVLKTVVPLTT